MTRYDMCIRALWHIRENGMSREHIKLIHDTSSYNEYLDKFLHEEHSYPDILLIRGDYLIMKEVLTLNGYELGKERLEWEG